MALRHQASKKPPLFKSTLAHPYEYQLEECKHWDPSTQQFYGEAGKGILSVQDGMITILRTNREGRVKVRIKKYLHGTNKMDYVKNDISGSAMRILHASLECRVIGGKHRLGVTVSRRDGSWITSNFLDVTSGEWEPLHTYLLDIPATEDFIIEFEDSQIERENSGIQLRNIKIEEIIH
ncbi:MAG: hypothetical protein J0H74_14585 [Chitinophagaceae bacterium]|nr:hypothetical protein [Chitinophagaceae bacterium]